MSAHVLLNLSNCWEILYNARLAEHLIAFSQRNNTGARMLDSIYHMTLNLIKNLIFGVKRQNVVIFNATL